MNPKTAPAPTGGIASTRSTAPGLSLDVSLDLVDPRIAALIAAETDRQRQKLVFIASESLCPKAVREAVGSPLSNLYAEGYPSSRMAVHERELLDWDARNLAFYRRYGDRRYYKGCDYVNLVEAEAMRRVAQLFATKDVPAHAIYANVQSLSGAAANNAVYEALVPAESTVMGCTSRPAATSRTARPSTAPASTSDRAVRRRRPRPAASTWRSCAPTR
jgi:glycine hydroxymethyltransferase